MVYSWIRNLSTYFKTSPTLQEAAKLQIVTLQLEGVAQAWWDTQVEQNVLTMNIGPSTTYHTPTIVSWDAFCDALRNRFYPPGYCQGLLACWMQLHQLSSQSVQAYIDIFCKLRVQLHDHEPKEVLVVKFSFGFLSFLGKEVDLFDNTSLDKAFLWTLVVERKVVSKLRNPPSPCPAATPSAANATHGSPWCTFHRSSTHSAADCRALKYSHT